MSEPFFIPLNYNGRALRLRAFQITNDRHEALPRWIVDVDGSLGSTHSLESAILHAARAADSIKAAEDKTR